ncbi:TPA: hypothetical protein ACRTNW_003083, partial [Aeromonas hydrophila]
CVANLNNEGLFLIYLEICAGYFSIYSWGAVDCSCDRTMNPHHYYSAIMPLLLPVVILISFIGPGRPVAALASCR